MADACSMDCLQGTATAVRPSPQPSIRPLTSSFLFIIGFLVLLLLPFSIHNVLMRFREQLVKHIPDTGLGTVDTTEEETLASYLAVMLSAYLLFLSFCFTNIGECLPALSLPGLLPGRSLRTFSFITGFAWFLPWLVTIVYVRSSSLVARCFAYISLACAALVVFMWLSWGIATSQWVSPW